MKSKKILFLYYLIFDKINLFIYSQHFKPSIDGSWIANERSLLIKHSRLMLKEKDKEKNNENLTKDITNSAENILSSTIKNNLNTEYSIKNLNTITIGNASISGSTIDNVSMSDNKSWINNFSLFYLKNKNFTLDSIISNSELKNNSYVDNTEYKDYLNFIDKCLYSEKNNSICTGDEFRHKIAQCSKLIEPSQIVKIFFNNLSESENNFYRFWVISRQDLLNVNVSNNFNQLEGFNCLGRNFYITYDENKLYGLANLDLYLNRLINSASAYFGGKNLIMRSNNENYDSVGSKSFVTRSYLINQVSIRFIYEKNIFSNQFKLTQYSKRKKRSGEQKTFSNDLLGCEFSNCVDLNSVNLAIQNNQSNLDLPQVNKIITLIDQVSETQNQDHWPFDLISSSSSDLSLSTLSNAKIANLTTKYNKLEFSTTKESHTKNYNDVIYIFFGFIGISCCALFVFLFVKFCNIFYKKSALNEKDTIATNLFLVNSQLSTTSLNKGEIEELKHREIGALY